MPGSPFPSLPSLLESTERAHPRQVSCQGSSCLAVCAAIRIAYLSGVDTTLHLTPPHLGWDWIRLDRIGWSCRMKLSWSLVSSLAGVIAHTIVAFVRVVSPKRHDRWDSSPQPMVSVPFWLPKRRRVAWKIACVPYFRPSVCFIVFLRRVRMIVRSVNRSMGGRKMDKIFLDMTKLTV